VRLSVSLGLWQDRPAAEVVRTAQVADGLGYGEIWIGEMATFDAFALGAVVAERTRRAALTIGPLAVAVRDPVMIAMGAGSLAELTGRTVNVALGSSSPVVVEQWHGRRQERTALALAESAAAVRTLLAGGKADVRGEVISTRGFRLRTRAPGTPLTIAAFGRRRWSSCGAGWWHTYPPRDTGRCSPRRDSKTWCASPGPARARLSCWRRYRRNWSATSRWPGTSRRFGRGWPSTDARAWTRWRWCQGPATRTPRAWQR
jgi:alkanesulfonate monooxygenase SsuD/methylene tetrahydromethanopterin reductase-like flavin-dependent oxidoreductase (luciferase family)